MEVDDIHVNGNALKQIMRSPEAQRLVNEKAEQICSAANAMSITKGAHYETAHKVLEVSAHAWIQTPFVTQNRAASYNTMIDEHYHHTLEKAFWASQE